MKIVVLTLFPEVFSSLFNSSIILRARKKKLLEIATLDIRKFATDKHKTVDDKPYGGGYGMLLKVDVIDKALIYCKKSILKNYSPKIFLLDPTGKVFTQSKAKIMSKQKSIILICGHYEGVDARVYNLIDETVSVGKYILSGGEIPAMLVLDATVRLIPGVIKNTNAIYDETFKTLNFKEAYQFTKPRKYKGMTVPNVLVSGNHKNILMWKKTSSEKRSAKKH